MKKIFFKIKRFNLVRKQKGGGISIFSMIIVPTLFVFAGLLLATTGYSNMAEKQAQNMADNLALFIAAQGEQTSVIDEGVEYRSCILSEDNFAEILGNPEEYSHGNYGPSINFLIETADGYNPYWSIEVLFIEDTSTTDGMRKDIIEVRVNYVVPPVSGFRDATFNDYYQRRYGGYPPNFDNYNSNRLFQGTTTARTECLD